MTSHTPTLARVTLLLAVLVMVLVLRVGSKPVIPAVEGPSLPKASELARDAEMLELGSVIAHSVMVSEDDELEAAQRLLVETASKPNPAAPSIGRVHVPTTGYRTQLRGRLVDETRAPLAAILVWLEPTDDSTTKVELPAVEHRGQTRRGWFVKTDAEGSFEFDLPTRIGRRNPSAKSAQLRLSVEAPVHRQSRPHRFGSSTTERLPKFVRGAMDLGEWMLAPAGVVYGQVLGANGSPVVSGVLRAREDASKQTRETKLDVDGRFLFAHLAPGTWSLDVEAFGFEETRIPALQVVADRTSAALQLTLNPSMVIHGVVVDDAKRPVDALMITATYMETLLSAPQEVRAVTNSKGQFKLELKKHVPHSLSVADERYLPWGGRDFIARYPPGTKDVRIVLQRVRTVQYCVVDAVSRQPVTWFSIGVENSSNSGYSRAWANETLNAGGCATVTADLGRCFVHIHGTGYPDLRLLLPANSTEAQVVYLRHGVRVQGRVMLDGKPSSVAFVNMRRSLVKAGTTSTGYYEPAGEHWGYDVNSLSPEGGTTQIPNPEGRFRFEKVLPGTYQVRVSLGMDAGMGPSEELQLVVREDEVDLGDIVLKQ